MSKYINFIKLLNNYHYFRIKGLNNSGAINVPVKTYAMIVFLPAKMNFVFTFLIIIEKIIVEKPNATIL